MNILLAPDTFKDSLSAKKVASAMKKGVEATGGKHRFFTISASDGGEGFLKSVKSNIADTTSIEMTTEDSLGRKVISTYVFDSNTKTAYIELAQSSGIELLSQTDRNPMLTSTYGTGQQIQDVIKKGAKKIYVGIGGSATNDGAIGIANALGYGFFDSDNKLLKPIGENLLRIKTIEKPQNSFSDIEFFAVNDVQNPLFGQTGAAFTYAKQKGASTNEIEELDKGLQNLHAQVLKHLNKNEAETPGAGAAGGTAYGLKCFLDADFISGTSFILQLSGFEALVKKEKIDLIITGEGKMDWQTKYGKFIYGMVQEAKRFDIPVMAVCGKIDLMEEEIDEIGLLAASEIYDATKPVSYSFDHAEKLIFQKTKSLFEEHFIR